MRLLPNKNASAYENAMIALFGAILLGVTSVFATLLYRAMPFLFDSLRTQDNGIAVPGGMDWIFTVNANGIFLVIGQVAAILFGVYLVVRIHRQADLTAFMLVDKSKIAAMGKRLRLAYGLVVFAFVLAALSFLFDAAVTLGYTQWVSSYYGWMFLAAVIVAAGMAVWWMKTVEFPRDVQFKIQD